MRYEVLLSSFIYDTSFCLRAQPRAICSRCEMKISGKRDRDLQTVLLTTYIDFKMNGLVEQLECNDPDFTTLALTSECETKLDLLEFLQALSVNTTAENVVFRESFFPFRRIRSHLGPEDFCTMLQAVGEKAKCLRIPETLAGMLRGKLAANTISPNNYLEEWIANSAITFCYADDVESMAERFSACENLRYVHLYDSYFLHFRSPKSASMMDPLLEAIGNVPLLQDFGLSSHPKYSRSLYPLVSSVATGILLQSPTLQTLSLCRLGLEDEHFQVIAEHLPFGNLVNLRLDWNLQSYLGTVKILDALRLNPLSLTYLSVVKMNPSNETYVALSSVDWSSIFQVNSTLQTLVLFDEQYLQIETFQFWLHLNCLGRSKWMEEASDLSGSLWPLGAWIVRPNLKFSFALLTDPLLLHFLLKSVGTNM